MFKRKKMQQKQVKIIGLKVNEQFGIVQSCDIHFDEKNKLIAFKGEVGSGKTTIQKALSLGTLGSDTLKDDKNLYGPIDQEVQLMDGDIPIFVGYKSDKEGKLVYVIYTKDIHGNIVKDPIVDGQKLTPSKYLKSLQTALTWRMDELTSENPTVQKKILLDLYKDDLSKVGVIYDKNHPDYVGSILDRIEKGEADRTEKEYARKQVGGFAKHLLENGYDVDKPETLPSRVNIDVLKADRDKTQYQLSNSVRDFEANKNSNLQEIRNESEKITLLLKEYNMKIQEKNKVRNDEYKSKLKWFNDGVSRIKSACDYTNLCADEGYISEELRSSITNSLNAKNELITPSKPDELELIPFSEDGKCIAKSFSFDEDVNDLIVKIDKLRGRYITEDQKTFDGDNSVKEEKLTALNMEIEIAESVNKVCDAIDAFNSWSEANKKVVKLKREYASKLNKINTGVDGLTIQMEEVGEKMNVHLMYNGEYSTEYFNNPSKEVRKLSSYSGTQKPMICLLIQNYLLGLKAKALRYLWIDNVPVDNKTKELLNTMGEKLNLTIFINITGDFDKDHLESGEILLEGGEVFFNEI